MKSKKGDASFITCPVEVGPILVRFSGGAGPKSNLQHCTRQFLEPNLKEEVVEELQWEVEGAQNRGHHCLVELVELRLWLQPYTVDNIERMLHSRRKPRMGLDLHHNIGRIGQHNRLDLWDCLHRVLMG
jgi:hypothetical protein